MSVRPRRIFEAWNVVKYRHRHMSNLSRKNAKNGYSRCNRPSHDGIARMGRTPIKRS